MGALKQESTSFEVELVGKLVTEQMKYYYINVLNAKSKNAENIGLIFNELMDCLNERVDYVANQFATNIENHTIENNQFYHSCVEELKTNFERLTKFLSDNTAEQLSEKFGINSDIHSMLIKQRELMEKAIESLN